MQDIWGFSYAAVILVGGLIGFIKAGSTSSLFTGITFGMLMAIAAFRSSRNPKNAHLALGISVVLSIVMGWRFSTSLKFMPAGLVTVLSLMMTIRYANRLMN